MEPVIDHIEITVRDVSTAVSFGRKSLERRNGQGRSASTSQAHMENGAGSAPRVPPDRMLQMVRNLLTDRFKLVVIGTNVSRRFTHSRSPWPTEPLGRGCVEPTPTVIRG